MLLNTKQNIFRYDQRFLGKGLVKRNNAYIWLDE